MFANKNLDLHSVPSSTEYSQKEKNIPEIDLKDFFPQTKEARRMNGICQALKIQLKRLARGNTLVHRHNRKMPETAACSNVCNRYVLKRLLHKALHSIRKPT